MNSIKNSVTGYIDNSSDVVKVVSLGTDSSLDAVEVVYCDLNGFAASKLSSRIDSAQTIQTIIAKVSAGEILPIEGYSLVHVVQAFPPKTLTILEAANQDRYRKVFFVGLTEALNDLALLAKILDIEESQLKQLVDNPDGEYTRFPLKKKSGKNRWINAPSALLKTVQVRIKDRILYKAWPTKYAHGFVNKRSIVTNATPHIGRKVVVNMDIKGFFDTITDNMVRNTLIRVLPAEYVLIINVVARLCTIEVTKEDGTKQRVTPQGAPTSPVLSNLVSRYMDFALKGVARNFHATYTGYADDMTFSSDVSELPKAIPIIMKVVNEHGFWINSKKTNVFRRGGRQIVTGLVVNDQISVPRRERMEFRAHLHHIITGKIRPEDVQLDRIKGFANYIHMVNSSQGTPFVQTVAAIESLLKGNSTPKKKCSKGKKRTKHEN